MLYELKFSPVFKITLRRLCSFLTRKYSSKLANDIKQQIRNEISDRLPSNPQLGPICDRLIDLGVPGYRQLLIGKHNTVVYRIDETSQHIIVLLVFDNRQSIEKLLNDVNLLI